MADLALAEAKHRHARIISPDQFEVAIDIDFAPVDGMMTSGKCHQRLAHRIAQVATLAVVEGEFQQSVIYESSGRIARNTGPLRRWTSIATDLPASSEPAITSKSLTESTS